MRLVRKLLRAGRFYKRKIEMTEEVKEPVEDIVTQDGVKAASDRGIDYDKLLTRFGC